MTLQRIDESGVLHQPKTDNIKVCYYPVCLAQKPLWDILLSNDGGREFITMGKTLFTIGYAAKKNDEFLPYLRKTALLA